MPAHPRVRAWIAQHYQKPAIDQEWLADCSDWIASELAIDPTRDFDQFIQHVEAQLLQSNLADSTVSGSGIDPLLVASNPPRPPNARHHARQKKTTGATPLLVEIKSITEIAHSAFNLLNTHQTRIDRADLGLAREENADQHRDEDEDEGPVPKFPRGMLRFELSDGLTTFRAIEFRSLPQLELGTTPLGYKMLLKSTPVRNGIAFLEPANVLLKGYRTEDHDNSSEQVFLSSLRKRLGRPDPPPEAPIVAQPNVNPPAQPIRQHQLPPVARPQSPPNDVDDMYVDDEVDPDVLREMLIQMDETIDMQGNQRTVHALPLSSSKEEHATSTNPKPALHLNTKMASSSLKAPVSSSVKTSSYFTAPSSGSSPLPDIGLSPHHASLPKLEPDFDITWDFDDMEPSHLPTQKHNSASAGLPSSPQAKQVVPSEKRPPSPDSFDDLSFDMDVNDSFFEQVGMIERTALGAGVNNKGKGRGRDTVEEGTHSRSSAAGRASDSLLGTESLTTCPVSPSGAEHSTRTQSSTKRAGSSSSLSVSTETPMPRSTQSSGRRLPRDPSLIVISSSEDEAPAGSHGAARLSQSVRKPAKKSVGMGQNHVADSDVIDISD